MTCNVTLGTNQAENVFQLIDSLMIIVKGTIAVNG